MSWILRAEGLTKTFADGAGQRRVLDALDLTLAAGDVVALKGPSGSGKTTLLNVIAGLLLPEAGTVRLAVGDEELALEQLDEEARTAARRAHMGYVFQFFNLVPTLTVRENVLLPLELNRRHELEARALARLEGLGLADRSHAFPHQLSGGERQRVAIARALAHEPRLVLADEPTGNLDADNAAAVAELLWEEVRRLDGTLLLATHDWAIADRAHRVIELGASRQAA